MIQARYKSSADPWRGINLFGLVNLILVDFLDITCAGLRKFPEKQWFWYHQSIENETVHFVLLGGRNVKNNFNFKINLKWFSVILEKLFVFNITVILRWNCSTLNCIQNKSGQKNWN